MNAAEARTRLIIDIINTNLSKDELNKRVVKLKAEFGTNAFPPYTYCFKDEPWDKDYYDSLKRLAMAGACSEEFVLHLYEVKDAVSGGKCKIINAIKSHPYATVCIVVGLIVVGFFLTRTR